MTLWFVAPAWLMVWAVFRDPRIDYRFLAIGALAPAVIDAPVGERAYAHTLLAPVAVLLVVLIVTAGRKPARPRLLMIPIGMLLHLVLEGLWTAPEQFWWPVLGVDLPGDELVPSASVIAIRDALGLLALVWFVRRFGLADRVRLRAFVRTGRVEIGAG